MLYQFLTQHREELIRRARGKVAQRSAPRPTTEELSVGIPLFFEQMIAVLRSTTAGPLLSRDSPALANDLNRTAADHGSEQLRQGFTLAQVVHDYGELCQAVTELAGELRVPISALEFQTFNGCLDSAIASAVTAYAQRREEGVSHVERQRLGVLVHEMRNLLSTVTIGFEMLRKGTVPIGGSTGALIARTLRSMHALVDRSMTQVRIDAGGVVRQRIRVAEVVEDVELSASQYASPRRVEFEVSTVPYSAFIEGDRQLLTAALVNLVQNAFKFTKQDGHVSLLTHVAEGRVILEIADECGGLKPGQAERMFQPFEQQSADRSGLGLGLSIALESVQSAGGELHVRNLVGHGCVFRVDLPEAGHEVPRNDDGRRVNVRDNETHSAADPLVAHGL